MKVLGLTGSIAMGKTTVAAQFAVLGAKILNADAVVHRLLDSGGEAVEPVARAFPLAREASRICRLKLRQEVFDHPQALQTLEAILHPLVRRHEREWLRRMRRLGVRLAVLDIPLLFETGFDRECDATATVTAAYFLQRQRALFRFGMHEARLKHVLARQLPDRIKRRRADFVIHTGLGRAYSFREVKEIWNILCAK